MRSLSKRLKAVLYRPTRAVATVVSLMVGLGSSACHADYITEVLADNPIAYYRLNEPTLASPVLNMGSAGAAIDGVYAQNGTGAGPGVPGAQPGFEVDNTSLRSFVSSGNVVRAVVADNDAFDTAGGLTIEAWIYRTPPAGDNTNDNEGIVTKYLGTGNQRSYALFYSATLGTLGFAVSSDGTGGSTVFHTPAGATIAEDAWTHIAAVFDPGNRMELFVNGQSVGTPLDTGVPTGVHAGSAELWIGGLANLATQRIFEGSIDEVAIYNYALDEDRILAHYQSAVPAVVPEPGTLLTVVLGAIGMAAFRRKAIF